VGAPRDTNTRLVSRDAGVDLLELRAQARSPYGCQLCAEGVQSRLRLTRHPAVQVRTMHALDHENILKFFAWYETQNHLWLVLEYCVGGDLLTILRQVAHHTPRERGGRRVLRASVSVCASVLTHRAPGKGAAAVGMGGRGGAP
jgi:serine/threonine protein kinase